MYICIMQIFQNLICTAAFFRSLPRAFSSYVNNGCDVVNSSLLNIFRFATVKFKIVLLEFFLHINNLELSSWSYGYDLWLYSLELGLLHAHMHVGEISKFLHGNYIVISNKVTKSKIAGHIGFVILCTAITTDEDISI